NDGRGAQTSSNSIWLRYRATVRRYCVGSRERTSGGSASDSPDESTSVRSEKALRRTSMRIAEYYSHLNGYEFIKVHKPGLWSEIEKVIAEVDVRKYRTKVSREKTMKGELLLSPKQLNKAVDAGFSKRGWKQRTASYWVTKDAKLIRKTLNMSPDEQKAEILAAGLEATRSFNQTDFVKDRV